MATRRRSGSSLQQGAVLLSTGLQRGAAAVAAATEKENKPWVSWSARRRSRSLARHCHRPDLLDRRQGPNTLPPPPSPPSPPPPATKKEN